MDLLLLFLFYFHMQLGLNGHLVTASINLFVLLLSYLSHAKGPSELTLRKLAKAAKPFCAGSTSSLPYGSSSSGADVCCLKVWYFHQVTEVCNLIWVYAHYIYNLSLKTF